MTKATLLIMTAVAAVIASAAPASESPDLVFSLPGHPEQHLNSYRGHVVALEFINTKCSHCQAAAKVMNKIQERFGAEGFQAIEVAINDDASSLVQKFAADRHLAFPVGWTNYDHMLAYMGYTGRALLPQLVLIDKNGEIRYRTPQKGDEHEAGLKQDVIASRVQELLHLPAEKTSASTGDSRLAKR